MTGDVRLLRAAAIQRVPCVTELTHIPLAEAREALAARAFSALELTEAYLAAIEAANPSLNAYIEVTGDKARAMAKASDEKLAAGQGGPLEGIPLGIKDLFGTKGVHTQAASHVLDRFKPEYESTVTSMLWRDGAVMLGKLNMDEFAMGSSNETSYYGPVINPWRAEGSNLDLVPGGSSGGSAAAVSAWLCAGATATDTGGSIRQPAAFTGTVGIKPTYGRCSRWGIVAFASSLDQAGPLARTVGDAAILMTSMSGLLIRLMASSVTKVRPVFSASPSDVAAICSFGHCTPSSRSRARPMLRSASPTKCIPVVTRHWLRNIVPNLPAPTWPIRTGFLASARARSICERFMGRGPLAA